MKNKMLMIATLAGVSIGSAVVGGTIVASASQNPGDVIKVENPENGDTTKSMKEDKLLIPFQAEYDGKKMKCIGLKAVGSYGATGITCDWTSLK